LLPYLFKDIYRKAMVLIKKGENRTRIGKIIFPAALTNHKSQRRGNKREGHSGQNKG